MKKYCLSLLLSVALSFAQAQDGANKATQTGGDTQASSAATSETKKSESAGASSQNSENSARGGKAIWDYATAEQARQANEIYRLAQQQGRKLTAQERKKLGEIEASIQVPEHLKKGK